MTFAPGTVLDRYTVEGVLGQGGMAIVYKVRHNQLGTAHALKVLQAPSAAVRERTIQEGRVQGKLRHANIVPVTDLVDMAGAPGLVMEFVDGPSLEALLERTRLTPEQSDTLAEGILEGMAHAHRQGFVHRDLKPANVLLAVTEEGLVPKVTDFGLAKMLGKDENLGQTRSGMVMGTPAYMAPEQIRDSKNVDQRADVFSLGVILYELVTGQKPFQGPDIVALYTAITKGRYRAVQELASNIPDRMERAITGALVVDRNARIQDAGKLLAIWRGETGKRKVPGPKTTWAPEALAGSPTMVPPAEFVPGPPAGPDGQITFHDNGPLPVSIPPRTHPILENMASLRIAPVEDRSRLESIDPSTHLVDDEVEDFRRGIGWAVPLLVAVGLIGLVGVGGAAWSGYLPIPWIGAQAAPGAASEAPPEGAEPAVGSEPARAASARPPPAQVPPSPAETPAVSRPAPPRADSAPPRADPAPPPEPAPVKTSAQTAAPAPAATPPPSESEPSVEDVRVVGSTEPAPAEAAPEAAPSASHTADPAVPTEHPAESDEGSTRALEVEYRPPPTPPPDPDALDTPEDSR